MRQNRVWVPMVVVALAFLSTGCMQLVRQWELDRVMEPVHGQLADHENHIAANAAAWETEPLASRAMEYPQCGVARDHLQYADKEFSSYATITIQGIINGTLQSILTGESEDAQAAMDAAQEQIDGILAEYQ